MEQDIYLTKSFIERSKKIHLDKDYDYSKVTCTKFSDYVTITCNIHGDFRLVAYSHIAGRGCRSCGNSMSQDEFKEKISKFSVNLLSPYLGVRETIKYFCERHGESEDIAENLLNGGCYRCKYPYRSIQDFIEYTYKIHGDHPTFVYHNLKEPILAASILNIYCLFCKQYSYPTVQNHIRSTCGCKYCWDGRRNKKD